MIIRVHYFSGLYEAFIYNDIDIGITCFCETRYDELGYILNRALEFCNEKSVAFNGFEIIAD